MARNPNSPAGSDRRRTGGRKQLRNDPPRSCPHCGSSFTLGKSSKEQYGCGHYIRRFGRKFITDPRHPCPHAGESR